MYKFNQFLFEDLPCTMPGSKGSVQKTDKISRVEFIF